MTITSTVQCFHQVLLLDTSISKNYVYLFDSSKIIVLQKSLSPESFYFRHFNILKIRLCFHGLLIVKNVVTTYDLEPLSLTQRRIIKFSYLLCFSQWTWFELFSQIYFIEWLSHKISHNILLTTCRYFSLGKHKCFMNLAFWISIILIVTRILVPKTSVPCRHFKLLS
jgi:hypothetical protein